jgi:hypothetical protein
MPDPTANQAAWLQNEIDFWSEQLLEHALFLYLGLVEPNHKAAAQQLVQHWRALREDPMALSIGNVMSLTAELRAFSADLLAELKSGKWLGWIFPTFVEHTIQELDLFVGHLQTGALLPNELCIWEHLMLEHASLVAHDLDPDERTKIARAAALAAAFGQLQAGCRRAVGPTALQLSDKFGRQLDSFLRGLGVGTSATMSIVHPILAAHAVREGVRFLETVNWLRARAPSPSVMIVMGGIGRSDAAAVLAAWL